VLRPAGDPEDDRWRLLQAVTSFVRNIYLLKWPRYFGVQASLRAKQLRIISSDELQKITVFSAGIATVSREPDAGKALIKFLASPEARDTLVKSGLDPIPASATH
jgi:hypothetical protein